MKYPFVIPALALLLCTSCGNAAAPASAPVETQAPSTEAPTETTSETPAPTTTTEPETTVTETEPVVLHAPHEDAILEVKTDIEAHDVLTVAELLTITNVELENGDALVDTSKIGPKHAELVYTFEGVRYTHTVPYIVSDTMPPVLLNGGWGTEIELGKPFDLNEHVGYADHYDATPTLTYTGFVDTGVCGSYPLTATVRDSCGNETSWDLTVEVVAQKTEPEDNAARISFDSFTQQYAGENVQFGIDVSKWQKDIDFHAVKAAGCSFVLMRMGYYYDEIAMDDYYLANMANARAAGLQVGIYIYTTANTEEEVRENAAWIAKQLDGQPLDFPVVFDWESFGNFQKYGMSIHDLNQLYLLFAEEMEGYGYDTMLYSSKNFLNNFWYPHSDHPIWLAHYTEQTNYEGDYVMWQASSRGRIPGITGDVDLNILYTDRAAAFFPMP